MSPSPLSQDAPRGSLRVAVVDDNPRMRQLLGLGLVDQGLEPIFFEDGFALLEHLEHDGLDLVLLDLMMPQPDGLECLRRLRARGFQGRLLICTALDDESLRRQALESGADGYLLKPDLLDDPLGLIGPFLTA